MYISGIRLTRQTTFLCPLHDYEPYGTAPEGNKINVFRVEISVSISGGTGLGITFVLQIDSGTNQNHQPWDYIDKVKESEILDKLSTFPKDMLAHLHGMEPGKKRIDFSIHMIPVDNH
jgi:hypothetical protein